MHPAQQDERDLAAALSSGEARERAACKRGMQAEEQSATKGDALLEIGQTAARELLSLLLLLGSILLPTQRTLAGQPREEQRHGCE